VQQHHVGVLGVNLVEFGPDQPVAAIILLTPRLDASYLAAKANPTPWADGRPALS